MPGVDEKMSAAAFVLVGRLPRVERFVFWVGHTWPGEDARLLDFRGGGDHDDDVEARSPIGLEEERHVHQRKPRPFRFPARHKRFRRFSYHRLTHYLAFRNPGR